MAPRPRLRRRSARGPAVGLAVGTAALAGALAAAGGKWLPCLAQPRAKELNLPAGGEAPGEEGAPPEPGSCKAALAAGQAALQPVRVSWEAAAASRRLLLSFGRAAVDAEKRALRAFDRELETPDACAPQRESLLEFVRREAWKAFLAQRQLLEEDVGDALADRLLAGMQRRGDALRVQEKIDFLRQAVDSYRKQVGRLLPEWAAEGGDPEAVNAERRLGKMQFGIEESDQGKFIRREIEGRRTQRMLNKRAHGVSVSLDPELRVLVRPDGLGSLQIFSNGPVGPPGQQATVNFGIMNDGSIAEVYREHPEPPRLTLQPAVRVNVNVR